VYLPAVLLPASPPSSLPDDPAHTSPHWQFKSGGKGGGFIYPFALSLSPNKSVLFVVHFYFQRLNNTPKRE
jgi:hypothetical protein